MPEFHHTLVTIKNRLGLHARPAMTLVDAANRYGSEIRVRRADSDEWIDAKSIMQVMMLAANQGTQLHIEACGSDAAAAVQELTALVDREFDESEAA